jgi:hypothetical protein
MSTTATAPSEVHPARQQAIQPFLEKLQAWCQSPGGSKDLELAAKISIGTQALVVEPWDRRHLQKFFQGAEQGLPKLVAHGMGLIIKSTLDVERLKKHQLSRSAEIYALQAELMLDSAIGLALLNEVDHAIEAEVQGGGVGTAKSLSAFRHKLARAVGNAKKRLADSDKRQADTLAACMTDRPIATARPEPPAEEPAVAPSTPRDTPLLIEDVAATAGESPRPRRRRRRRLRTTTASVPHVSAPEPALGRTAVLSLAVAALAGIWLGFVQLPAMLATGVPVIESSQIDAAVDLTVVARPSSLYVTVPTGHWESLGDDQKQGLIDSIGTLASGEDYLGATLTTDEGKPVGRWLRSRGSEQLLQDDGTPDRP